MSNHKQELLSIIDDWNAGKPVKVIAFGGPDFGPYLERVFWTCVFCCVLKNIDMEPPVSADGFDHYDESDPVWDAYASKFYESTNAVIHGMRQQCAYEFGISGEVAAVAKVTARELIGEGMASHLEQYGSDPDRVILLDKGIYRGVTPELWTVTPGQATATASAP